MKNPLAPIGSLWRGTTERFGYPKVFITLFLVLLCVLAVIQGQSMPGFLKDTLTRLSMIGVLTLAMVPGIVSGIGLNFGVSIGILTGLLAGCIGVELGFTGVGGFFLTNLVAIPISTIVGLGYGWLLNRVKGDEMTVSTYVGFSMVSLMCIFWLILPFKSPIMIWAIGGKGLRNTIAIKDTFGQALDNFLHIDMFGLQMPLGSLIWLAILCFLMWVFLRSKAGVTMSAAGDNPRFARAIGINVNKQRLLGTTLSTVLGAIGILAYAHGFGFFQLYVGPLNMPFIPVAAVLIGGATMRRVTISHVISGTILMQALLIIALPVISKIVPDGAFSEVIRIIVSNGVILYALTRSGGGK